MYGKIVDGKLEIAGKIIKIKNSWITNPTEEQLKANGYKEITTTEKQSYDKESEKLVETYNETSKGIEISYSKVKLTDEEINNVLETKVSDELDKVNKLEMLKAIAGDKEAVSKVEEVLKNIYAIENKKK